MASMLALNEVDSGYNVGQTKLKNWYLLLLAKHAALRNKSKY